MENEEIFEELTALEPIEIIWMDSHKINASWMDAEEIEEYQGSEEDTFVIHTVGYFYEKSDSFVYVIQSYDSNTNRRFDSMIAIPTVSILDLKRLKEGS